MKLNELEDFPKLGNTIVLDGNIYVKKQEPLTDESICEILLKKEWFGFIELVRMIEKAHGIGGEDENE